MGPPTAGADVAINTADAHTITYGADSGALTINSLTILGNNQPALDVFDIAGGALTITTGGTFSAA